MEPVQALFFDVFGTLVDWRSGVAREAEALLSPLGYRLDWSAFADSWRAQYQPSLDQVRSGAAPFRKLDVLHRQNLVRILPQFGVSLSEAALDELNQAWHRLDAWPDVAPGLLRLRTRFLIAPVSNGNVSIMVALGRRNGLVWDAVLGADWARDYKPNPRVYQVACEAFDLAPSACMLVAAHEWDLTGAAAAGLRTAFVYRPNESGPTGARPQPQGGFEIMATSFADLATRLGV
jgi:2-haloacid dehalogenase